MKKYIRSFFLAPFIICLFNRMAVPLNMFIPFNVYTIIIVGILELPGLIMLVIISFLFF